MGWNDVVPSLREKLKEAPGVKPTVKCLVRPVRRHAAELRRGEPRFRCPVCGACTVFLDVHQLQGRRRWAECARCGAYERHRLQAAVLDERVLPSLEASSTRCLQLAPDVLTPWLQDRVGELVTADLFARGADRRLDVRHLDVPDEAFDMVFASHVLEHVDDDRCAIAEIWRVLAPGGVAVLPVPIVAPRTVEYGFANPQEEYHVRAPGFDYFDRYRERFRAVEVATSADVPADIQPWIHEDRSPFPSPAAPMRPAMAGDRHADAVPLCWK